MSTPAAVQTRTLTLLEAIREALADEMAADPRVVLLGEDIAQLGGVFRATDGLLATFGPERVIDTPMMELGIVGIAVGMAMKGLRPVAEIQFADFMHAAADHLISDAARIRYRSNGDWSVPLVVRTAYGGGFRGGPYHSQSVEAFYSHVPGLRVVTPSFPADAKGLLTAAIRDPDPVLFLEHKRIYRAVKGEVPTGELVLPLDRANVVRTGQQVTVVAWGWVLHEAIAAVEAEGIDAEIIDPRTLNPLDSDTIMASVRKTGRLLVAHEDTRSMGVGAEIAALAVESALDDLRAPVRRVTMPDVAGIPASGPMEDFLIPDRVQIGQALRELCRVDRAPSPNGVTALASPRPTASEAPQAASVVEIELSKAAAALAEQSASLAQRGLQASYTPLFAAALISALRAVPHANASFEADELRIHAAIHLGVSVERGDTARHGLVEDADTRSQLGLALEIERIRQHGDSDPAILARATATLADYGPDSALFAVPLVQPGQVVAVRVGAVDERIFSRGRGFGVAPTAFVSASVDHRALDGKDAGGLLAAMKQFLETDPTRE